MVAHVEEFHGLPAFTFPQHDLTPKLPDPETVAWRLECNGLYSNSEDGDVYFARFLDLVELDKVRALILGASWYGSEWDGDATGTVETLVGLRDRLTGLEALYLGDLTFEESEISWIGQCDVAPVLTAYPDLRELAIRGSTGLEFPVMRHEGLRALRFHCGGLPASVVRNVIACDLPALDTLEMWLGVEEYGGDATLDDLAPLLSGGRFPALRHLGLQDSELQDEIAAAVASAPVVAQLTSLDLSMGILSDTGAEALLAGQPLTHLKELNLRHHYLTDTMMQRVREALAGVAVNLDEQESVDEDDEFDSRYVAVGE